jgi:hypothetical protein
LKRSLGLPRTILGFADGSQKTLNAEDLEKAASELQSSRDQFAAAEVIDQMQAYYNVSATWIYLDCQF